MFRRNLMPALLAALVLVAPGLVMTAGAAGKAFNPDISVNFLGLYEQGTNLSNDSTQVPHNGLSLQEAELQIFSDVDPYLRASALLSISQENNSPDYGIDPEEVFVETISIPGVTFRAGKFKMAVDKTNQMHTHAFPFIDAPLIDQQLLGSEGLNEPGVSASVLMPTSWFSEVSVQGFSASDRGQSFFNSSQAGDVGGLVHVRNLWDLNDDSTLGFELSGAAGKNQFSATSSLVAAELTYKWRPAVGGKYHAFIWNTEYLDGDRTGLTDSTTGLPADRLGGIATWIQYQFAERWWVQGRYEYVGLPRSETLADLDKQSLLLGFFPSEFSGFRVQYDRTDTHGSGRIDNAVAFQYNITIGAHPAHSY